MVLLGKRGFDEEAGEPTPASKLRSVRQKTSEGTDLPFLLPQPLFTAGGGGGGSSSRHGYQVPTVGHDDGGRSEGRAARGGKGGKKKAKEPTSRNRRKPMRSSVSHNKVGYGRGAA